jgi:hypothetical protein
MKKSTISFFVSFIVFLLIIHPLLPETVYGRSEQNDLYQKSFVTMTYLDCIWTKHISFAKVDNILDELLSIEETFTGLVKINRQLNVFQNHSIVPSSLTVTNFIDSVHDMNLFPTRTNMSFHGPFLVSHLTCGSRIKGLVPCWNPLFHNVLINRSHLHGVGGILPVYCGVSKTPVYLTVYDYSASEFFSDVYSSFFEVMIPCIGFSLAVHTGNPEHVLFEYNLDYCICGFFGNLEGIHF